MNLFPRFNSIQALYRHGIKTVAYCCIACGFTGCAAIEFTLKGEPWSAAIFAGFSIANGFMAARIVGDLFDDLGLREGR